MPPDQTKPHLPNPAAASPRHGSAEPSPDATAVALARLASTRQRLLQTMAPRLSGNADQTTGSGTHFPMRWLALGRVLLSRGPSAALLRAATSTLGHWWHAQPWATTADMLGRAVVQEVRPVVRHHPLLMLGAAVAVGAAMVSFRPWIWRTVRPYTAPLGTQLRRRAWGLFTMAPVQMAIAAALAAWLGDQQRDAASAREAPALPPRPGSGKETV